MSFFILSYFLKTFAGTFNGMPPQKLLQVLEEKNCLEHIFQEGLPT